MAERDNKGAGLAIGREPVTAELRLDNPLREAIKAAALADRTDPNAPVVSLRVNGLFPARPAWSGAQVFLNLPAVPEDLDPDLLSPKSPHYAGSFSFFPKSGKMLNFLAPRAAAALKGIVERGELKNDTLRVTLVGIPGDEEREREAVRDGATVPFSQVSLHVRPRASHPGATP